MTTVLNVACAFLELAEVKKQNMTPLKLQKLVYYAQALSLVKYDETLFNERIEAWVHGPVVPRLYSELKDQYLRNEYITENALKEYSYKFSNRQNDIIKEIFDAYGSLSGMQLESLTHNDSPWIEARRELNPWENSDNVISTEAIRVFYKNKYEKREKLNRETNI